MRLNSICIGSPSSPTYLTVYFSQTTVIISWISPDTSTHCIVSYITKTNTSNNILTTTNTSVSIPLAGLSSDTTYCFSVAAVDTANRRGTYSEEICFILKCKYIGIRDCLLGKDTWQVAFIKTMLRILLCLLSAEISKKFGTQYLCIFIFMPGKKAIAVQYAKFYIVILYIELSLFSLCCYSVPSQLSVSTILLNGPEDDKATIRVLWTVSI